MPQIRAQFGDGVAVRYSLNNAVARGQAQNLNIGLGRKAGGLFVRMRDPAPRAAAGRPLAEPMTLDFRTGVHLQQVWRVQPGMSA